MPSYLFEIGHNFANQRDDKVACIRSEQIALSVSRNFWEYCTTMSRSSLV